MNTKGANLLLSTMLIASCVATPAFAEGTDATAAPITAHDITSEGPKEPTPAEMNASKDRGIIITDINPPKTKPTAEVKKSKPTINRVSKTGDQVFTRGLVIETPTKKQPSLMIKPQGKAVKVTPLAVQTSTTTPIKVKNTVKTQTAKSTAKPTEVVATTKSAASKNTISVVAPASSGEQIVTAWLNKSGNKPHYTSGEKLQVNVAANKDCNLMIFNYDGDQLVQLYPNEFQASPFVKAGQTVEVGGKGFKFDLTATNPAKQASSEKIFVYAYPIESDSSPISVAMAKIPSSPFRAAEMTPDQYRDLVNNSAVFFGRKVSVTAKKSSEVEEVQLASFEESPQQGSPANKIELSLVIEGSKRN